MITSVWRVWLEGRELGAWVGSFFISPAVSGGTASPAVSRVLVPDVRPPPSPADSGPVIAAQSNFSMDSVPDTATHTLPTGGETTGGETSGGETSGEETTGQETPGGETSGGETSGGEKESGTSKPSGSTELGLTVTSSSDGPASSEVVRPYQSINSFSGEDKTQRVETEPEKETETPGDNPEGSNPDTEAGLSPNEASAENPTLTSSLPTTADAKPTPDENRIAPTSVYLTTPEEPFNPTIPSSLPTTANAKPTSDETRIAPTSVYLTTPEEPFNPNIAK